MKISHSTVHHHYHRGSAQVASARADVLRGDTPAGAAPGSETPSPATPATSANESARPAKAADAGGQKAVPPGLERVLARLQDNASPARNGGQANALDRISRNIARYVENQAMAEPPPAVVPAPTSPPVADAGGSTTTTEAPSETTPPAISTSA